MTYADLISIVCVVEFIFILILLMTIRELESEFNDLKETLKRMIESIGKR